jgi:hypothetical protein
MKTKRTAWRARYHWGATLALTAFVVGCSGGTHIPLLTGNAAQAFGRSVRVAIQLTMPTPTDYLTNAPDAIKTELVARGFALNATELIAPPFPARGYFLKIGDSYYPSDSNGTFFIPNNVTVPATVPLYKQRNEPSPVGEVAITPVLVNATELPRTVLLNIRGRGLGAPIDMDGHSTKRSVTRKACCAEKQVHPEHATRGRAIDDGCIRRDYDLTSNQPGVGACADYDTSKGRIVGEDEGEEDETSIDGNCGAKRVAEFLGTPCYNWTHGYGSRYSAECWNERAYWQLIGPSCWENHKYRFCQNMSMTDFSVSVGTTVTVTVGETLSISVRNNTPKYDTTVTQSGDAGGTLSGTGYVTGGVFSSAYIQHYDDSAKTHIPARTLTYTAPSELPNGQTEAHDTLTFSAHGITKTVAIRVVQRCQNAQGREVPCP